MLLAINALLSEGSSIMQERSHAFAMKSQILLIDTRPNLSAIVKAIGDGFGLSERHYQPAQSDGLVSVCGLSE